MRRTRKKIIKEILTWAWIITVYLIILFILRYFYGPITVGMCFLALFILIVISIIGSLIMYMISLAKEGIDPLITRETDPNVLKDRMLIIMRNARFGGIKGKLEELNEIFRNYPRWELEKWVVFRAWYKDLVDHAIEHPDIYTMRMKDGSEYSKETDPLYDPDAPDWKQYDRDYYFDDDDDDFNDTDDKSNLRKSAEDGFYTGIGLGVTDNILNK